MTRYSLLLGGEAWGRGQPGGHGVIAGTVDRGGLHRDGRLGLEYNTDTLRLSAYRFRFRNGQLELGARIEAQAYFAGLLPDYYLNGRRRQERGFRASYAATQSYAKLNLPGHHHPELRIGVRQWWFSPQATTDERFILPPDTKVLELQLSHTWWRLNEDAAWGQPHRSYPRMEGWAAGIGLGLDWRADARPWGARDSGHFVQADRRNNPSDEAVSLNQWIRGGRQWTPNWRVQLLQQFRWVGHADDIRRYRIGGMNPYVVPLAGAPWATWLSDRILAASISMHRRVRGEIEAGVAGDVASVKDAARTGGNKSATLTGLSGFVDARFGRAQLDARIGWTPDVRGGQTAVFLAAGWIWE